MDSNSRVPAGQLMPRPWFRANNTASTLMSIYKTDIGGAKRTAPLREGERELNWFILPPFQRPPVWTEAQKVRFIESAWAGLPLGSYVFNRVWKSASPFDNWLLDGQQRITAIIEYTEDKFRVHGKLWSELTPIDHRQFAMTPMACMETQIENEDELREIYDRLAYGGTAHDPKDSEKEVYWELRFNGQKEEEYSDNADARKAYARVKDRSPQWQLVEITRFDRVLPTEEACFDG